jgi:hypothetical protein
MASADKAENKYDGECNNVGMFKRPNQKALTPIRRGSSIIARRGAPSLIMFCHKLMDALKTNAPLANVV